MPETVPDRQIPPLVLITFIENAFKHGVSYQQESFIEMKITLEKDSLLFSCRNSKVGGMDNSPLSKATDKGGVGLVNVRKRLDLLYGLNYSLHIDDTPDIFIVELVIPLSS
jgi:sensor histidine kinase YesM